MKKVLITGADSFVGMSFEKYVKEHYSGQILIDTIDMIDGSWRNKDFSRYDVVFHVAGIAHADVSHVSETVKSQYYAVNTDLAIDTAKKAKQQGVGQFVFMSSSIVYGDFAPYGEKKIIKRETEPLPTSFYGDSKWKADKGIRELSNESFVVTILRPPMIYGKGSKGNYQTLAKLAKKLPFFPDIKNERSMLYIENLCEFLVWVMLGNKGGVFWPQNAEYSRTSEMVRLIAATSGHKIVVSKAWNWTVEIASRIPGKVGNLANKAFGSMIYDQSMSICDFDYRIIDLRTSVERTEE